MSEESKLKVTASVSFTVRVDIEGPYAGDWTFDAIHKNALSAAILKVEAAFHGQNTKGIVLCGTPEIVAVSTERKR